MSTLPITPPPTFLRFAHCLRLAAASVLLSLLGLHSAQAQRQQVTTYSVEDGLPQTRVPALVEGQNGYLWVASWGEGVARFDGTTFQPFTTADGLANNLVCATFEDREGRVWVGSPDGVSRYEGEAAGRFAAYPISTTGSGDPLLSELCTLTQTADGTVWFGNGSGLYRRGDHRFQPVAALDGVPVYSLLARPEGGLWIGTREGLFLYDGERVTHLVAPEALQDATESTAQAIWSIASDDTGRLWLATSYGVVQYQGASLHLVEETHGYEAVALLRSHNGELWISLIGEGLGRLVDGEFRLFSTAEGLCSNSIVSLTEDHSGNLWLGSHANGLCRLRSFAFEVFGEQEGLADPMIWDILSADDGTLWLGTQSGLTRYREGSFSSLTRGDGLPGETVYALEEGPAGDLWVGLRRAGVARYDGTSFYTLSEEDGLPSRSVFSLEADDRGRLWIGTRAGAAVVEGGRVRADTTLPATAIWQIYQDRQRRLWFATETGVHLRDASGVQRLPLPDTLQTFPASSIVEDRFGAFWISSYTGGLVRYVPEREGQPEELTWLAEAAGLPNPIIWFLTLDEQDRLWLGHTKELSWIDTRRYAEDGTAAFFTYGPADYPGGEGALNAAVRDTEGRLWMSLTSGLVRYDPARDRSRATTPHARITGLRLFYKTQEFSTWADSIDAQTGLPVNLTLPHNQNHLSFLFKGVDLSTPQHLHYQYRLEGADQQEWSPAGTERQATYASLSPGTYTFLVRTVAGENPSEASMASFSFTIAAPFWQQSWFILLMLALAAGGVATIVRWRTGALERQRRHLEQVVTQRTHELRAEKEHAERVNLELEQLSLVASGTDNVVCITDADGRIEWINEAFTSTTGFTLEELRQERGATIMEVSEHPNLAALIARSQERGEPTVYDTRFVTKDGRILWFSSTLSIVTDAEGQPRKMVIIDTDITAHKELERALIAARNEAEEAARAKSEFLANMSHEIRTPMNGVIGMTGLLLDTDLTEEQQELAGVIRTSGEALLGIINDILDFSKIDAGKIDLEEQAVELHRVVEEALDLVAPKAAEKRLELAYFLGREVPPVVMGDVTRLRQILTNLLANAVKFTDDGEVTVTCSVDERQGETFVLRFDVRDTGIGISERQRGRLFRSFSQVDASTTRKYGGTGLGLAISKRLSELMGGSMWVESTPGTGSTFSFTITAQRATEAAPTPFPVDPALLRDRHVLVVDDNATNRRMLELQTTRWGMQPHLAASAQAALDYVDAGHPVDVALLDLQMPQTDGLELAHELAERRPNLPLILLSALGDYVDADDVPLQASLTKPVKQQRLCETLCRTFMPVPPTQTAAPPDEVAFDKAMAQRCPLRILVAEDNSVNQKVALQMLQRLGYRADVAANGQEAIDALEQVAYDVVLMDVQMPEMDGLEATRRLRQDPAHADSLVIIAMTAGALEGDRTRCLAAGMDDYITKPVQPAELVDALRMAWTRIHPETSETREGRLPGTSTAEAAPTAISLDTIRSMAGDDEHFIAEILEDYLQDAPSLIATIHHALASDDLPALQHAAHTLKSTSEMLGARSLRDVSFRLEQAGEEGAQERASRLAQDLDATYTVIEQAIRSHLDNRRQ